MTSNADFSLFQDDDSDVEDNIFVKLGQFVPSGGAVAKVDELDAYLNGAPEMPEDGNTLRWWYRNRAVYPRLSIMAMDFLSIPGECSGLIVGIG